MAASEENSVLFPIFILTIMALPLVPYTILKLCRAASKKAKVNGIRCSCCSILLLSAIQVFEPFSILGLEPGASDSEIKKAYRRLSVQYHPDKNPDPEAHTYFVEYIAKAYQALTDPISRENFEKYGHPDGRQIGLLVRKHDGGDEGDESKIFPYKSLTSCRNSQTIPCISRELMANRKMAATYLALVLVGMLCAGVTAQSGCTNVLISLSPCLNYITGTSSTPSQQCCAQLANVVRSSPQCLCQVLNGGGSSLGININQTQAIALPGSCNVRTPPISSCNVASPAPADSPVGPPESGSITPTGGGSKTVPSAQEGGSSDGSTAKLSLSLFIVLLVATSYSSILLSH
ncbi:hypothetical protein GQ457_13G026830 [Hibiscus cannabinus]